MSVGSKYPYEEAERRYNDCTRSQDALCSADVDGIDGRRELLKTDIANLTGSGSRVLGILRMLGGVGGRTKGGVVSSFSLEVCDDIL